MNYIEAMRTKRTIKTSPRRDPDKKLLGAWVGSDLYESVKKCAVSRGHGNVSVVVIEAVTDYLRRSGSGAK